jgi:hypothetical protein
VPTEARHTMSGLSCGHCALPPPSFPFLERMFRARATRRTGVDGDVGGGWSRVRWRWHVMRLRLFYPIDAAQNKIRPLFSTSGPSSH